VVSAFEYRSALDRFAQCVRYTSQVVAEQVPVAVKFRGTFMLGEIPSTGDVLRLLVDPKDPRHFATASSLRR
jgi:hypothetical protein